MAQYMVNKEYTIRDVPRYALKRNIIPIRQITPNGRIRD